MMILGVKNEVERVPFMHDLFSIQVASFNNKGFNAEMFIIFFSHIKDSYALRHQVCGRQGKGKKKERERRCKGQGLPEHMMGSQIKFNQSICCVTMGFWIPKNYKKAAILQLNEPHPLRPFG